MSAVLELENQIKLHHENAMLKDKLDRLKRVPEFKELVLDGFINEHANRCLSLATTVKVDSPEYKTLVAEAVATKQFENYLNTKAALAAAATPDKLAELEEELFEARKEELEANQDDGE